MFGHLHYVPVLKGKRGEFGAIGLLKDREGVTPFFEALTKGGPESVPVGIEKQWGCEPFFIDHLYTDDEDSPEDLYADQFVYQCFQKAAKLGQRAIPVTGTFRSPAYQRATQEIVRVHNNGVGIRLVLDDFEEEIAETLAALMEYIGVAAADVDIFIDLGAVADQRTAMLAQSVRACVDMLPDLDEWRTLTILSGAFPAGLGPMVPGWNAAPRTDWTAWQAVITGPRQPRRLPSYGDFNINHVSPPFEGRGKTLAQLRYTLDSQFLVWKGQDAHKHGFEQFIDICADLAERDEFSGADFSWGDREIAEKAANGGSPGNAETWRKIGATHHVEMVKVQLANLRVP